jgi:hypothetical protein
MKNGVFWDVTPCGSWLLFMLWGLSLSAGKFKMEKALPVLIPIVIQLSIVEDQ